MAAYLALKGPLLLRRQERRSSSTLPVTIFLYCDACAGERPEAAVLLKLSSVGLFLRPIWALIFARAWRRDRSVSRTSTSYRALQRTLVNPDLAVDIPQRLSR